MKNILITSCIPAKEGGGVANVENQIIEGLKAHQIPVLTDFPYRRSMFITDFYDGLGLPNKIKDYDVINSHTNISWNTPGAVRVFHGCTAQGEEVSKQQQGKVLTGGLYFKINAFMEKLCAQKNKCIAVSNYTADGISRFYGVPRKDIFVIHNGVDTDKFYPCKTCQWEMREELGISKDAFVVGWVGGFDFNKGIYYLKQIIDDCKDNKNIVFVVRASVTSEIPEEYKWITNTPQVIFSPYGWDMSEFYNMCDLFLHTATYDPCPLSVIEAMSCGKPVICFKTGGHSEIVQTGLNGYVVTNYKDTRLVSNTINWLSKQPKLVKTLGRYARKRVLEKFTIKHMIDKYIEVFENV
jgi:glycosyltransferase involved in cell wall biosynthesis